MSDKPIKYVSVEYIESGTFQGGEENVSEAGIEYGEECVVISKANFKKLKEFEKDYKTIRGFVINNAEGDIDFIKYQIAQLDKKK
jgi:hypothetical protein